MQDHVLKGANGSMIGKITTDKNGVQKIYNRMNHMQGTYDPKTNETRNRMNHFVAKGNMLTTLLTN